MKSSLVEEYDIAADLQKKNTTVGFKAGAAVWSKIKMEGLEKIC